MPSSTPKQARTMAAAAHNPAFAKKVGIPQSVASEFNQADKGTQLLSQSMKARHLRRREPERGETKAHERGESRSFERTERD